MMCVGYLQTIKQYNKIEIDALREVHSDLRVMNFPKGLKKASHTDSICFFGRMVQFLSYPLQFSGGAGVKGTDQVEDISGSRGN